MSMLVYLRCLEDGKSWLVPYRIIHKYNNVSSFFITRSGRMGQVMKVYEVTDQELPDKLAEYFNALLTSGDESHNSLTLQNRETLITPITANTQKEHFNRERLFRSIL